MSFNFFKKLSGEERNDNENSKSNNFLSSSKDNIKKLITNSNVINYIKYYAITYFNMISFILEGSPNPPIKEKISNDVVEISSDYKNTQKNDKAIVKFDKIAYLESLYRLDTKPTLDLNDHRELSKIVYICIEFILNNRHKKIIIDEIKSNPEYDTMDGQKLIAVAYILYKLKIIDLDIND